MTDAWAAVALFTVIGCCIAYALGRYVGARENRSREESKIE